MTKEEKAKAYDEAYNVAESIHRFSSNPAEIKRMEEIFPQLREREDERIRKELKQYLEECTNLPNGKYCRADFFDWIEKQGETSPILSNSLDIGKDAWSEEEQNRFAKVVLTSCAMSFIDYLDAHKYEGKMCVSNGECEDIENAFHNAMWDRLHRYYCKYIEKQGEQKPAWSEEDDYNLQCCIAKVQYDIDNGRIGMNRELLTWLNSLKNRVGYEVNYTTTKEWSEDDEKMLKDTIRFCELCGNQVSANWLKSLRPQSQWKPSFQQMKQLNWVAEQNIDNMLGKELMTLYKDLEKLRGE